MTEDRKADYQVLPIVANTFLGESVQAMEGMNPDISLGVPFRILLTTNQCLDFRKIFDPSTIFQKSKARGKIISLKKVFSTPQTIFQEEAPPYP